jgi:hypothetical protein
MFCKILVALLFPVFTISCYANSSAFDRFHKDVSLALSQIVQEQPDSICSFDGERMYLMSHRIFPTNDGMYLCHDQSFIFLPLLLKDQNGIYLPCLKSITMRCINPSCGYCCWNAYRDGIECPVCCIPGDPA